MKIYTGNPCGNAKYIALLKKQDVGVMLSVGKNGRSIKQLKDIDVAVDNGAFQSYVRGFPFLSDLFWKLLHDTYLAGANPDFIVCPDIVAGGKQSLSFSLDWAKNKIIGCSRLALAVQDGMETTDIRSYERQFFSWIFVGGTVEWKWRNAEKWVKFAHDNNMKCHIGRCGTIEKLRTAKKIGADSVDSTSILRNNRWDILEELKNNKQIEMQFPEKNTKEVEPSTSTNKG